VPAEELEWEEVGLGECLNESTGAEALEYARPRCGKVVIAIKLSKFMTFPEVLALHAKEFQLVNWVPTKLDAPIILPPSNSLSTRIKAKVSNPPKPSFLPNPTPALSQFNETPMAQLEGPMGFATVRFQKVLLATGNSGDAERLWSDCLRIWRNRMLVVLFKLRVGVWEGLVGYRFQKNR